MNDHTLYNIEIVSATKVRYAFECLRLPTKDELIAELRHQVQLLHDEADQAAEDDLYEYRASELCDQSSNLENLVEVVMYCAALPDGQFDSSEIAVTIAGVNIGWLRFKERTVRG